MTPEEMKVLITRITDGIKMQEKLLGLLGEAKREAELSRGLLCAVQSALQSKVKEMTKRPPLTECERQVADDYLSEITTWRRGAVLPVLATSDEEE